MNETKAWDALRPRLAAAGLDPVRVENVVGDGTPDVSITRGWIETKWIAAWPKRATTKVKVKFEPNQIPWIIRRVTAGGLVWVFLRVGDDCLLFSGLAVQALAVGRTKEQLHEMALWSSRGAGSTSDVWLALILALKFGGMSRK